jgi:hypothetical protein
MGCRCNLTGYYRLFKAADIKQKATSGHLVLSFGSKELTWMATKKALPTQYVCTKQGKIGAYLATRFMYVLLS